MILRSNTNKAGILELVAKIRGIFDSFGSRLLKIENWGMRTLAYPIKRNRTGLYMYWRFLGGSDVVQEFERVLKINDAVVRYYTVRVEDDVDPDARPSEVTEDLLEQVSEPPPDPTIEEPTDERDDDDDHDRDDDDDNDDDNEGVN
ncbi:MAG: 30S ribosomal protein S6 [Myxococcales bacterium]|nr:30S ribosomal protein S6 [Myxococcales bacterium]